ncbi:ectonucleotide pyrophosphatase/phosphodiesterase family member 5-like [Antedon mediterranea]|uniref:ectonucleotide pyrophosphatase/phosphodiesterase family member 5-like n=1 Tax=Antedon mediterranea TaxID=105859 RepID=UPI003AF5ADD8
MEVVRYLFLFSLIFELEGVAVDSEQKLLFILVDGLRYDYMDNANTPNLDEMAKQGVRVNFLTNVFPTMVPSKVSLVTGLYPESHGLVHNTMYDSVHDSYAMAINRNESYWWNAGISEPIWVTARKQGKISGSVDYFGGFAEIDGVGANNFTDNRFANLSTKMNIAIDWLNKGTDVVVLEWKRLDLIAHFSGPNSTDIKDNCEEFDRNIGYLREQIRKLKLQDELNIIIAGDHGITEISNKNVINLSDFINLDDTLAYIADSPVAMILPKDGFLESMYSKLVNAHPNMKVYKKEDVPEYYHYRGHYRILPIVAIADLPWMILANGTDVGDHLADHGFDNQELSMKSMMLAEGPSFKTNFTIDSLNAIDMYELMCSILHLKAAPNNGSLSNIKDILSYSVSSAADRHKDDDDTSAASVSTILTLMYPVLFMLFFLLNN